jgi:hypothetical protein
MMPMLVTPTHLLNPISTNDLQLVPMVWKLESETGALSSLIVFRFFKSFKQWRTFAESSYGKSKGSSIKNYILKNQ